MSFHSDLITKLGGMLPDRFEQLCCRLLPRLVEEYQGLEPSINRDGKTTKGAADAFKRLPDGSYIVFAFTTQQSALVPKIKTDLEKIASLKIRVKKVVVCFNTQIKLENDLAYNAVAQQYGWELEVYSLHRLAECLRGHADLLTEFLDLTPTESRAQIAFEDGGFLIGERLQQLRAELELQRSEIIKLIGYPSEKAYLEMETNIRECNNAVVEQLYNTFGILPDWLTIGSLPKYETDALVWWQTPGECLSKLFELAPERLYVSLQTRKPHDWLGRLRDIRDGFMSILGHIDFDIAGYAEPFHLGLIAQVGPYRFHTYDLAAGLNLWELHRPHAVKLFYDFLHTLIYGSRFEVLGVIIPDWQLNGALYAGHVHPVEVLRRVPRSWGIEWPYQILDLAQERPGTRQGRHTYGRWFSRIQDTFHQALAESE